MSQHCLFGRRVFIARSSRDENYRVACTRYLRECCERARENDSLLLAIVPLFNDLNLTSVTCINRESRKKNVQNKFLNKNQIYYEIKIID